MFELKDGNKFKEKNKLWEDLRKKFKNYTNSVFLLFDTNSFSADYISLLQTCFHKTIFTTKLIVYKLNVEWKQKTYR